MTKLKFELPDRQTPGYLRRQREALKFLSMLRDDPTPAAIDSMVEYLVQFVKEPGDNEAAREALWDASEEQFFTLLNAITGEANENGNPTSAAENDSG